MDILQLVVLISTVSIAVIGWIVGHILSSRREILQKRREIRIQYLRQAYLNLSQVADTGGNFTKNISLIQASLNDIQLFGDPEHIDLIEKLISDLETKNTVPMDNLLMQLRDEIRNHLRLSKIEGGRWSVRLYPKDNDGAPGATGSLPASEDI